MTLESNLQARLYIDLLKRCVSNAIYDDDLDLMRASFQEDAGTSKLKAVNAAPADPNLKRLGGVWPSRAHTMIGQPRLDNLQKCIESVLQDDIPGDLIEAGVWRGGASIFMRGILKAYGVENRTVWVADSFEGLPPTDAARHAADAQLALDRFSDLAVSLEKVRENFNRYGLLDQQVKFLKGWFCNTLPGAPIEALSIMRLDGDLYESTMDALKSLYPKLVAGGYVILDDYNAVVGCNEATEEYRKAQGISEPLTLIQGIGAFWRKMS